MYKYLVISLLMMLRLSYAQNVVINEVMASNKTSILDEDGDPSDWIEIYNIGDVQIDLSGYYLSDDSLDLQKWNFDSAFIQPHEHLLVFASDKNKISTYRHTNFKISASGEEIFLCNASGSIVDKVFIPASSVDISYGRKTDGSPEMIFQSPTPGYENSGIELKGVADSVSFSLPAGFYPSTISIELTAGDCKIYYTVDGSDPDSSKTLYTQPVSIQKTSVLKAISLKDSFMPGPVVIKSYFINENTDLPVVSLSSDPYNLFDFNYGIYADGPGWTASAPHYGANYWKDWERPAHVEFFDDNKNLGFSENCGIAIYGAYTRSFPQKSFSVKFKNDYGVNKIEYPLFPGFYVNTFKSFLLRNSGNDFQYTHIRDAFMQTLIKDLDIDYLEYRPATAFINGEYWGIYNIREKISEHYVANRHGVDPDSIDMLEGNMDVIHGDATHYQQLLDYISSQDMTTDEAYNYVTSMIDLDECLLYFAAEAYYNSQDWPANNVKIWRERSEKGKWRWILFDVDFGFNLYESTGQSEDHVYYIFSGVETRPGSNPPWSTLLPRMLVKNPKIKNQYINLVADLLNTKFKPARVNGIMNQMAGHIANEITKHRSRWGIAGENLNRMTTFANERPAYLRGFVRNFFNCGLDGSLRIYSNDGGKVKLNSLTLSLTDMPWSGTYFQGNEVHLKAVPLPGYKFDGWSGSVTSAEESIDVSITRSTSLTATFSKDSLNTKDIVINEINYNSSDQFDSGDWIELYNNSNASVDLSGWNYSDSDETHKFTFPEGTILEADNYLVLVENDSAFTARYPTITNYIGEMDFGLSGSGEFMKLTDSNNQIIDSLTYNDKHPWPTDADGLGATLELVNPDSNNTVGENWLASNGHGSPGQLNSVFTAVDRKKDKNNPESFCLFQNYPNPFNPSTTIKFSIPTPPVSSPLLKGRTKEGFVTLKVYDVLGCEVTTLVNENMPAGEYEIIFNAESTFGGLPSGIYYYQLVAGDFIQTKKMVLMK